MSWTVTLRLPNRFAAARLRMNKSILCPRILLPVSLTT